MNEYQQNIEVMKDLKARIDKVLGTQPEAVVKYPDPKLHQYVSFIKSGLRILAGGCIVAAGYSIMTDGWLIAGGVLLIGAEILGIIEELV